MPKKPRLFSRVVVFCVQEQYADETFVHVLGAGQIPHTRHVRGSNFVYISVFPDRLPGRAIIIAGTSCLRQNSQPVLERAL